MTTNMKVCIIGDNIVSSLGFTTGENVAAVRRGDSGLRYYADRLEVPEPFVASAVCRERIGDAAERLGVSSEKYTRFERLSIVSVADAVAGEGSGFVVPADVIRFIDNQRKCRIAG